MILEVKNVVKIHPGGNIANNNISLTVNTGEVFGLLGPNGAGKTTLINQIIGLTVPTSGSIHLNNIDIVKNPAYARKSCSFQPQSHVPVDGLTPLQALEIIGRIRGGNKLDIKKKAYELLEKFQITDWANKPGEKLSGGVRRLVAFCLAVIVPGRVVILDEPTNDVDPLRRRLLWKEVRSIADTGRAVLLVTHNVLEAERAVDRLAIINCSKVLKVGTPAAFKEYGADKLTLEFILEPTAQTPALPDFLSRPYISGRRHRAYINSKDLSNVVDWAQTMQANKVVEEFFIGPINLEDAYMQMTAQTGDMANK